MRPWHLTSDSFLLSLSPLLCRSFDHISLAVLDCENVGSEVHLIMLNHRPCHHTLNKVLLNAIHQLTDHISNLFPRRIRSVPRPPNVPTSPTLDIIPAPASPAGRRRERRSVVDMSGRAQRVTGTRTSNRYWINVRGFGRLGGLWGSRKRVGVEYDSGIRMIWGRIVGIHKAAFGGGGISLGLLVVLQMCCQLRLG